MTDARRLPLVRPPMQAQGGSAANPFGGSGVPGIATADSRRAQLLAMQYADDERGRFTERVFAFPDFGPLSPGGFTTDGAFASSQIEVQSNRTDFVRLVAMRGTLANTNTLPLTGLELANLLLRLQINGEEDLTTAGNGSAPASFDSLFSNVAAPWFWFAAPPRLRVGDTVQALIANNFIVTEGSPTLTPALVLRLVDDAWWEMLYGT